MNKVIVFVITLIWTMQALAAHPAYPIIFVHGIIGSEETFIDFMQYLDGGNPELAWGGACVFDVLLNADDNVETSNSTIDVKWEDFEFDGNLVHLGPRNYDENWENCTDGWSDTDSYLFAINFKEERIRGAGEWLDDFDQGNQSAIYKQGKALGKMIEAVLVHVNSADGSPDIEIDKVILVGHSMGGLAIREYLQRADTSGFHPWWVDPSDSSGHKVARVVTVDTPHFGSNIWTDPTLRDSTRSIIPDGNGESIRDLTYHYDSYPQCPDDDSEWGIYLFGGSEYCIEGTWINPTFHNVDVNCNGSEDDNIIGINYVPPEQVENPNYISYLENPEMDLPGDIDYTWITGNAPGHIGDGIVKFERQYLISRGDTVQTNCCHTSGQWFYDIFPGWTDCVCYAPTYFPGIIRGLDEPDSLASAYQVDIGNIYQGFFTYQLNHLVEDTDWFRFELDHTDSIQVLVDGNESGIALVRLYDDEGILAEGDSNNLPIVITQTLLPGTYWLELVGDAGLETWQHPYSLRIGFHHEEQEPNNDFATATPISIGLTPMNAELDPTSDNDYFRYEVVEGYGYTVRLEWESGVDVEVFVYDHLQNALEANSGTNSFSYYCSTSGTNYARVKRDGGLATGSYSLRVFPAYWNGDVFAEWDEVYEPNPHWYQSYLLPTDGSSHFAYMESASDYDYYYFTGQEGVDYTIWLSDEQGSDTELFVYDRSMNALQGYSGVNSYSFGSTYTQRYYVRVKRDGGTVTGSYQISILESEASYAVDVIPSTVILHPGDYDYILHASSSNSSGIAWSSNDESVVTVNSSGQLSAVGIGVATVRAASQDSLASYDEAVIYVNPVDDFEPNDNFAQALPLTIGQEMTALRIESSSDNDYFRYEVVEGYGYTVRLEWESGVDVEVFVYDHLQNALEANSGTNSFSYYCSTSGTNYARVKRDGGLATGSYSLRVFPAYWNGDVFAEWDEVYEPNPHWYQSYLLPTDGSSHFAYMESASDYDYYRFTGQEGSEYTVWLSEEQGSNAELFVYDQYMNRLSSSSGTNAFTFTSSESQVYYVLSKRDGGTATGNYLVNIEGPEYLDSPQNLSVVISENSVTLSWEPVSGATNYIVYSSTNPYSTYTEDTSGSLEGCNWTAPISYEDRFFRVVAVDEVIIISQSGVQEIPITGR